MRPKFRFEWAILAAVVVIISLSIITFWRSIAYPVHYRINHQIEDHRLVIDSIAAPDTADISQALLLGIVNRQDSLIENQNLQFHDEMGQEVNNEINRLNGWLSFWMSVFAVIGIGTPLVIQYRNETREQAAREQLKRLSNENERKVQNAIESLSKARKRFMHDCQEARTLTEKEVRLSLAQLKFTHIVNCINTGIDNNAFPELYNGRALLCRLSLDALSSYQSLLIEIKVLGDNYEDYTKKAEVLRESLIYINSLLIKVGSTLGIGQTVNVIKLKDRLIGCLSELNKVTNESLNDLIAEVSNIKGEI